MERQKGGEGGVRGGTGGTPSDAGVFGKGKRMGPSLGFGRGTTRTAKRCGLAFDRAGLARKTEVHVIGLLRSGGVNA